MKDSLFCASVVKDSPATPLGLHLWAPPSSSNGVVIIAHIADHGLFANKLKVGMQLHRINNITCADMSVQEIMDYLQSCSGRVSIMTKSPRWGFNNKKSSTLSTRGSRLTKRLSTVIAAQRCKDFSDDETMSSSLSSTTGDDYNMEEAEAEQDFF